MSSDALADAFIAFAFVSPLLYLVLQPVTLLRLRGGWRTAATVPLIGAIPVLAWSLFALLQQSNLWPLTFIFFAPFGTVYLLALLVIRYCKTGSLGL